MKPSRRTDHLAKLVSPPFRFFWGLALMAALIFLPSWPEKTLLTLMGAALTLLAGKRIQFFYFLFLIATVILFHLFLPFGKVLWQAGPFLVTEGALKEGYDKGITLCGLVFFSLFSVNKNLKLPGSFGRLWALTFSYYEQLLEERKALKPQKLLLSIDGLLERLLPTKGTEISIPIKDSQPVRTRPLGLFLIILSLVLTLAIRFVFQEIS